MTFAADTVELDQIVKSIRQEFQTGGSVTAMLLVLLGIVALVMITYWLTRRQEQHAQPSVLDDAHALFESLLGHLPLSDPQRHFLRSVARELKLEQPSVLLVSRQLYHRHVREWQEKNGQSGHPDRHSGPPAVAAETARVLFPGW